MNRFEEYTQMGADLGVIPEGESFEQQDPTWFPLEVSLALWRRLKALEEACQLDPTLPAQGRLVGKRRLLVTKRQRDPGLDTHALDDTD